MTLIPNPAVDVFSVRRRARDRTIFTASVVVAEFGHFHRLEGADSPLYRQSSI